ncbi:MAG: VWA domain-containing protein [Bacteroidales bacterium]|nr:VWA domain-containing protein [Bacteroidales bacterium]
MDYKVDIVMCIDVTGSMQPCIDTVRDNALKFWPDLQTALQAAKKDVSQVRVKVIAFRDFAVDGFAALQQSDFFVLSDQGSDDAERYKEFLNGLVADGGGDYPENQLEVLGMAIQETDWVRTGDRQRHIIVMFTDADAHPLEKQVGKDNDLYPKNGPKSFQELTELWMPVGQMGPKSKLKQAAKRLVLFAPDEDVWNKIMTNWNQTIGAVTEASVGLGDVQYGDIINSIVGSV